MSDFALPPAALDISGQRFGLLVAREPVSSDDYGVRWLLDCDCGRTAVRYAARLRYSLRTGHESACAQCVEELKRGYFADRRDARGAFWANVWSEYGDLWSSDSLTALEERIKNDCIAELGFGPEDTIALPIVPFWDGAEQRRKANPHVSFQEDPLLRAQLETVLERELAQRAEVAASAPAPSAIPGCIVVATLPTEPPWQCPPPCNEAHFTQEAWCLECGEVRPSRGTDVNPSTR